MICGEFIKNYNPMSYVHLFGNVFNFISFFLPAFPFSSDSLKALWDVQSFRDGRTLSEASIKTKHCFLSKNNSFKNCDETCIKCYMSMPEQFPMYSLNFRIYSSQCLNT